MVVFSCCNKDRKRKLPLPWTGPNKIVQEILEETDCIQHVSCRKCQIVVHFDRLKRCPFGIRLQIPDTPCAMSSPPHLFTMRYVFVSCHICFARESFCTSSTFSLHPSYSQKNQLLFSSCIVCRIYVVYLNLIALLYISTISLSHTCI